MSSQKIQTLLNLTDIYEGRSINKLQNDIFLLIFEIRKIQNVVLVRNLILSNSSELYYNDATVAQFVNDKYGDITLESVP